MHDMIRCINAIGEIERKHVIIETMHENELTMYVLTANNASMKM